MVIENRYADALDIVRANRGGTEGVCVADVPLRSALVWILRSCSPPPDAVPCGGGGASATTMFVYNNNNRGPIPRLYFCLYWWWCGPNGFGQGYRFDIFGLVLVRSHVASVAKPYSHTAAMLACLFSYFKRSMTSLMDQSLPYSNHGSQVQRFCITVASLTEVSSHRQAWPLPSSENGWHELLSVPSEAWKRSEKNAIYCQSMYCGKTIHCWIRRIAQPQWLVRLTKSVWSNL